jgi:ribosome modulation factor
VYLRRQDELIESGYKQSVKAGLTGRRFSFHGYTRMYDYSVLLAGWSQAFGRERIVAKVYDEGLARRGVVADVVETLGIRVGVVPEIEERSNPSMHPALVELQRLANALGETQSDAVSLVRERIGSLESGAVRSFLSTDERQAILAAYAESNAEVARTYFGRPDGHLFDDPQERLDGAGRDAPIEVLAALGVLLASELSRVQEQVNGLLRRLDSDPR